MADRQRIPLCYVCRQPVRPEHLGWSQVTLVGDQHHFHHHCRDKVRGWDRG